MASFLDTQLSQVFLQQPRMISSLEDCITMLFLYSLFILLPCESLYVENTDYTGFGAKLHGS